MAGVRKGGSFTFGLLSGGLIGLALALLVAPDRGEETRSRVRSQAGPLAERVRDTVQRAAHRGEGDAEEGTPEGTGGGG
jgi:gas vesicle protein